MAEDTAQQPEPSGSSSTANAPHELVLVQFPLKLISWRLDSHHDLLSNPILLQEKNGPCPLIALCNTLLLNHDVRNTNTTTALDENPTYFTDPQDRTKEIAVDNFKSKLVSRYHSDGKITLDDVLQYLGDLLLVYIEGVEDRFKFTIDELLLNLPKLHTGLNVNPILYSGDFQQDLGTELFDIFDLKFKHGWIVDPVNEEPDVWTDDEYRTLVELINSLEDFDRVQDYLLHDESDPEIHHNKELLTKWLSLNQTQLTTQGIRELNGSLNVDEFVVFFRNNHFNTLFKKSDSEFYVLLTDSSFTSTSHASNKPSQIIWQSVNGVSGNDDLFFTGEFAPVLDIDQDLPNVGGDPNDTDYLLLRQLQEEEDQKMAAGLQKKYDKRKPNNGNANGNTATTAPASATPNEAKSPITNPGTAKLKEVTEVKKDKGKKKKFCIIT
ncbi:Protein FAM63A [Candida viswanathii]|uniref:Protein FAM63A n=1 Tax=Candida viswanathii TaxID=5486 RepID=A0A367YLK5_9ASCO|nr:Protein FAM63A [Candida viswanathii]